MASKRCESSFQTCQPLSVRSFDRSEEARRHSIAESIFSKAHRLTKRLRQTLLSSAALFHEDAYGVTWTATRHRLTASYQPTSRSYGDPPSRVFLLGDKDIPVDDVLRSSESLRNKKKQHSLDSFKIVEPQHTSLIRQSIKDSVRTGHRRTQSITINPKMENQGTNTSASRINLSSIAHPSKHNTSSNRLRKKGMVLVGSGPMPGGVQNEISHLKEIIQQCYLETHLDRGVEFAAGCPPCSDDVTQVHDATCHAHEICENVSPNDHLSCYVEHQSHIDQLKQIDKLRKVTQTITLR